MIKKFCLVVGVLGLVIFSGVAGAAEVPRVIDDTYVYDGAGVIEEGVEADLNGKLRGLEKDTSAEIFVVTVDGLDGEAIEDFSYKTANEMGIGQEEHDNGLLLLVSPPEGTRNVRIEVGKGMEGIFNDAKAGRILDADFVPYREDGNYQEGIVKTVDSLVAETRENAEWVGKAAADDEWLVFVVFGFVAMIFGFVGLGWMYSAYRAGKKGMAKMGKSNMGFWAIVGLGSIMMNEDRERFRERYGREGGGWFGSGSGGGGGFGGGGSGGGSFGGGGATR